MSRRYPGRQRRFMAPVYVVALLLSAAGTIALAWLSWHFAGLHPLPGYLLAINVVTVLAYGYDKSIAGSRASRVPEGVLHLLALAGGSPGALLAQSLFRHKTLKRSFRIRFWLIVAVQVIVLGIWLFFRQVPT